MECLAQCPYCWERLEIWVDPGGASEQRYVEDCSVCCRPMQVVASLQATDPYADPQDFDEDRAAPSEEASEDPAEPQREARVLLLRLDD